MPHTTGSIHNAVVLFWSGVFITVQIWKGGATWSKHDVNMWCNLATTFLIPWALSLSIDEIIWWLFSVPCSPIKPSPPMYVLMCGMQCFSNMCCFGMLLNGNIFLYIDMYLSIAASVLVPELGSIGSVWHMAQWKRLTLPPPPPPRMDTSIHRQESARLGTGI